MATGEQTSLADRKRRAGQRLIVGLAGPTPSPEFRAFCQSVNPGGFILFRRNVEEPQQVKELNRELTGLVLDQTPPFLSVDQEGGRVQRVRETQWPPMRDVGNIDNLETTKQVAKGLADELGAMGFNVNWAPVADVDSNPKNPVIGDRSFSREPETCARHVAAFIATMQKHGVIGSAKHFPGHGDTTVDSHLDLPIVEKDRGDLYDCEMVPFRAAIAAGVGFVMTAHVLFPAWDEAVPATMSEPIIRNILRNELGFEGVVVSDDLEMKAVRDRYPLDRQLSLASQATVDAFLVCESLDLQMEAFETLVRLQEKDPRHEQLAIDAVQRIGQLRERFFLHPPPPPELSVVGSLDHKMIAKTIQQRGRG